jgi:hypothetical protein
VGSQPGIDYVLPPDSDNDKIADSWENNYGGNLDPNADDDTDGIINIDEYRGVRWGKMVSSDYVKSNPGSFDSNLVALCNKYQTTAYLPAGSGYEVGYIDYIRTDPTKKNLFVRYEGFGTSTHTRCGSTYNITYPFAVGAAFKNADIQMLAVRKEDYISQNLGKNNIDYVKFTLLETAPTRDGHTLRKDKRKWEFDTVGSSCLGNSQYYGNDPWFGPNQNCFPTGTNAYRQAIRFYYEDLPYRDGGGCVAANYRLDKLIEVDDKM